MYVFALSRARVPTRIVNFDARAVILDLHCIPVLVVMIGAVFPFLVVGVSLEVKVVI